jgi:hypothetical protein
MRRRLATLVVVVGAALSLTPSSLGDGGWGAGIPCTDDPCVVVKP